MQNFRSNYLLNCQWRNEEMFEAKDVKEIFKIISLNTTAVQNTVHITQY